MKCHNLGLTHWSAGCEARDARAIFRYSPWHPREDTTRQAVTLHLSQEVSPLPGVETLLLLIPFPAYFFFQ